ncbi:MAG: DUF4382 domain-containing protein [Candidatus Nanohaloarchaea archaeon]|nr:DUF4382 domain-containing protein [Candidatus Nanohaloarchaea archaeon]
MRRTLLITGVLALTVLAGCTSPTNQTGAEGTFELLISDQPADIEDFSSLTVTFSEARVFPAEAADEPANETDAAANDTEEDVNESENADFRTIDINGRSVDLTTVIGMNATSIVNASLPAGNYSKIELHVTQAVGIVNGSQVSVKVPSEKLQITKSFEISPNTTTSFVFDIHVVKRGRAGGYILRPVITASGVVGEGVEQPATGGRPAEIPEQGGPANTPGT